MKYFLILFFSLPLFAFTYITSDHTCTDSSRTKVFLSKVGPDSSLYTDNPETVATFSGQWFCGSSGATFYEYTNVGNSAPYLRADLTIYYYTYASCPSGTLPNSLGVCVAPAPCSWAVSPWKPIPLTGYNSTSCTPLNLNGLYGSTLTSFYVSDASFCTSNSTCYARSASCPVGQKYDYIKSKCLYPTGDDTKCASGYTSRNYSLSIDGITKTCFTEKICKDNPTIKQTFEVSCGLDPADKTPTTGASGPTTPVLAPDSSKPPVTKSLGDCISSNFSARSACIPPNVLTFSCNPLTGEVTKSVCSSPTLPTPTAPTAGDDTKAATTEDIKNLSNTLPTSIRDAIKDYFSDGSSSHLESIRGSLEASTILQSDANDKLDFLSASADASLVLQSDSNSKLDDLKTSTDGVKDALTTGGTYTGDAVPTSADTDPDATLVSSFDTFTNSVTAVQQQFNQAKMTFNGGLPVPTFTGGSCPSYTFYGNSVSLNKIGDSISPYSSIFALLIYISSVIASFRLVINFLSRGV